MIIEISNTTLTRLVNYETVTRKSYQEAQNRQWRIMTLDVMQECERLCQRMRHVTQVAAYSLYLYKLQNGLSPRRSIYAEPAISQGLVGLMEELNIPVRMIPDNCEAQMASC
ncbi:hypothetical protein [Desulfuromonas acetoxidans]|uniref:Uncharacterized protein n=1 Tax=Desulfuromonas acetoxidans (strain DSM 684 / 11070) TaxID=281689 RepID=Q1K1C1_DESA6|nr:hypothetical protein [Desulfuromonas acetoxidans]EAT16467.1 hypothetical protein Dace_1931 [Desulfuromonas acetoxidans DSM 684]MBF0644860.1 hypothetical protein [Desulfuromonas acetoxidans]NVD23607.1 hypothetical protein [Desulfuromonas acetoxidans]NVE16008.1 hypothetical protein [Desulfuromonas acetoxidans]